MVNWRVGTVIPGVAVELSDLYAMNSLEFGEFEMHLQRLMVHALVLGVLIVYLLLDTLLLVLLFLNFFS
jgi:hypothetical protein